MLGICNGFQILCESGLLPGALIRNRSLRFVCRRVHLRVETSASAVTRDLSTGETLEVPIKHGEGQFVARPQELERIEDEGLVVFRYASRRGVADDDHNPNGAMDNIAGLRNARGNVVGLMPHPEHAVDPDVGPTGGQPLFASLLASATAKARVSDEWRSAGAVAPATGPERRRARPDRGHARSRAATGRARHVRRHVVGALFVQVLEDPSAHPAHRGPGGAGGSGAGRRRRGRGRRHGGGLQDGVALAPQRHRALPGCGHRRGRHRARHHLHGRAPGGAAGLR